MLRGLIIGALFLSSALYATAQELITENGKVFKLYKVEKSEGLYRISVNNNVTQEEIIAANPEIQQSGLVEGMTIKIPIKTTEMNVSEVGYSIYVVGKGETAYSISKKFDMLLVDLYRLNPGIEGGVAEGQRLKVRGVANEARQYNIHTIAAGETLYSIGVKYGVKAQQIIDCNPALDPNSLPIGTQLRIPDTQIPTEDNNFIYHRIEKGETLYALCNKYNMLQDKIMAANDAINWQALQVGQVVAIPKVVQPKKNIKTHEVQKRETLYSISKLYNVSIADIEKENPDVDLTKLQKGKVIKIPQIEEVAAQFEGPATANPEYVGVDQTEYAVAPAPTTFGRTINVALMLPFNAEREMQKTSYIPKDEENPQMYAIKTRPYVEFYEGVKLAADSLQEAGNNVNLHVYDVNNNLALVNALNNNDIEFDLILGPAHLDDMRTMSDYALRNRIPVVFPFAQMDSTIFDNPYLFQASVTDTLTNEVIYSKMIADCEGKHIILLNPNQEVQRAYYIIDRMARQKGIEVSKLTYNTKRPADFLPLLKPEKENVIILPTTKESIVNSQITSIAGAIDQKKDVKVQLFGVGEWLQFSTIEVDVFHKLNTSIYAIFAVDYTDQQTLWLLNKYRKAYFTEPVPFTPYFNSIKSNPYSGFSEYGLWGYDIAIKFIGACAEYGKGFERKINEYKAPTVQTNFRFKSLSNWGGSVNVGMKRITFNADNTMQVVDF